MGRFKGQAAARPLRENSRDTLLDAASALMREQDTPDIGIVDIAARAGVNHAMICYYFGSKEGLYIRVLEEAYRRIRQIEAGLHLEDLPPEDALRKLVGFTVDYQLAHPEFIRLVMTENIHRGQYLAQSESIRALNVPAIDGLRQLYERGVAQGVFRAGIDPVDLHMSISALSFFNTANRHTFALIFKRDFDSAAAVVARRDSIVEMIVRFVRR